MATTRHVYVRAIEVRAIGWVATRDAFSEMSRTLFGLQRRVPITALRRIGATWSAVKDSCEADRRRVRFDLTELTGGCLSKRTKAAVRAFAEQLVTSCPSLYSEQALRKRCLDGCAQTIAAVALGAILSYCSAPANVIIGEFSLIFLAIGCWSLVTTLQLWRTLHLIAGLGLYAAPAADAVDDLGTGQRPSGGGRVDQ